MASDPPSSEVAQGVTCNPTLTYYPVRGPHNNGSDPTAGDSSQWTCDDAHSNSDYNTSQPHLGNDIWAAEGTPVIATNSGSLVLTGFTPDSGNHVTLIDSCGWYHFSTHLQSIAPGIENGKTITAGTVIGYVGNSGTLSNGVIHLHYSIYPDNNYDAGIDPWPYLHAVEHNVCNLPGQTATQMQLVALTSAGLYHTVRASAGTWSGFGNVLGQTGALAGITRIAEAGVGGDMQLVALANDTIYHAVRTAAGAWTGWGNVEGQVGALTGITGLAAAGVSGQLQVVAVANDTVYHAIRNSAGTWTAWGNVEGAVGSLTHVTAIAA
ncbi:MAG TPA: M23 family metallopeptidase, partial [Kofleriaceae bacterium]|nr:M23 family metallopeptidase [Kofleriaceae bacterium]